MYWFFSGIKIHVGLHAFKVVSNPRLLVRSLLLFTDQRFPAFH